MSDPNLNTPAAKIAKSAKPAKPRRLFRVLFGLSLALNLLVIGAFVGVITKGPGSRGGPPGLREISAPYVQAFDQSAKREMRREMRAQLPGRSKAVEANKTDYVAFLAVVRADPFDAARGSAIMENQLARAGRFQKRGRELAIERIGAMSLDERATYADRLQKWLDHKRPRRSKKER